MYYNVTMYYYYYYLKIYNNYYYYYYYLLLLPPCLAETETLSRLGYFELVHAIQDGKEIKKAQCKLCKDTQLAYKGSTTNMINHIQS